MKEGDVVLARILQADGSLKNRPASILRELPRFHDLLVCGISTKLHQYVDDFDELLSPGDADFTSSVVLSESLIRLGFLAVFPRSRVPGVIGSISPARHQRPLRRLSEYLVHP